LGGHARAVLEAGATKLIGLDRDLEAVARARVALAGFGPRAEVVHADYRQMGEVLEARQVAGVEGVLVDLGVSSMQLDAAGRGFSFQRDEVLDMRMDTSSGPTAAEMVAAADERTLADVIHELGEERYARRIARAIVAARSAAPIESTGRLADVVRRAVPRRGYARIDPATRTFQAIRIWVNRERGPHRGAVVPFARGPDREAHVPRAAERDTAAGAGADETAGAAERGGDRAQPPRAQRQAARRRGAVSAGAPAARRSS
jgi:16S rRNA (cytosine1402-N4)-methyltransferase